MNRIFAFIAVLAAFALPLSPARAEERYVVTASWLAEIFVELGASDQIVGTGGGMDHLKPLAGKPRLPGFRQTSAESVLALKPTTLVSTTDVMDPAVAAQLRKAGVKVQLFEPEPTLAAIERRIRKVAAMTGRRERGEQVVAKFRADMASARALVAKAKTKPRGLFILSGGRRPTLVAGRGTGPANLIELAGGVNVATGFDGFKPMSQEVMVAAAPQFILVNKDGLEMKDGVPVAMAAPGAQQTPAWRNRRVISLPGEYLQGFGILTPKAIRALALQLHPDLAGKR